MWVDFHIHTSWSKDSMSSPRDVVRVAVKRGLDAIAVTDHNEISGALEALGEARYLGADLRIIIGEEVKTNKGDIIGLFLTERIPRGLTPEETIDLIREQGGLVVIPHPFDRRWRGALGDYIKRIVDKVDFIEIFNGRTPPWNNEKARRFSEEFGIPGLGGSDAHWTSEIGKVRTKVKEVGDGKIEPIKIVGDWWPPIPLGAIYSSVAKILKLL